MRSTDSMSIGYRITARAATSAAARSCCARPPKTRCTKASARSRSRPVAGGASQVTARTYAASIRGRSSTPRTSRSGLSGIRSSSNTRSQKSRAAGPTNVPVSSNDRARSTIAGSSRRVSGLSGACARADGCTPPIAPNVNATAQSVLRITSPSRPQPSNPPSNGGDCSAHRECPCLTAPELHGARPMDSRKLVRLGPSLPNL